jgi:hypothetical protein
MSDETTTKVSDARAEQSCSRRLRVRYVLLTIALASTQLWAFAAMRNVYPVAAWTMMLMRGDELQRGRNYFVLRGETVSGETVEVRATELTDALYSRAWSLVEATARNGSFRLRHPHPENAALLAAAGGFEKLPRGARLPELLRAWGEIHNERLPKDSPRRLRAVRLDAYRWTGGRYADYDKHTESWRVEL